MYCNNCGKEIIEDFGTCPYCKTPIGQTSNNQNRNKNLYGYNQKNNNSTLSNFFVCIGIIIGIIFIIYGFSLNLDTAKNWNKYPSTTTKSPTTTTPSTTTTTTSTPSTTNITLKNYQQIYNEYSQKLIQAGPTSSITEMADILKERCNKNGSIYVFCKWNRWPICNISKLGR